MIPTKLLIVIAATALAARPDEGQWLPQQVLSMNWNELRARGLQLSKGQFWHPERGGVLTAAVQINGCSASFVSAEGLVVTNHHCGFGAINRLSTVETNYVRDGFVAGDRAGELPAPGMQVFVVRKIDNVTDRIRAAQQRARTDLQRYQLTQRAISELIREGEKQPNTACHVASFLEGQEYHLYHRTRIEDVRLVYAPPRSVGEYGGEVDNWEWPRHTGDFSFFRAYVAPDGTPRKHHEDNVPYQPKHHLRVSPLGVQDGDLVLIMGYPGRTERYLTSAAVADREGFYYPTRYRLFTRFLRILEAAGEGDAKLALSLETKIKTLANVQKNALGMVKGLARNKVVSRKMGEEAAFASWIENGETRRDKWGDVLAQYKALDAHARATQQKDMILGMLGSAFFVPTFANLCGATSRVLGSKPEGFELSRQVRAALSNKDFSKDFGRIGRPILEIVLDEARRLPEDQRIAGTNWLRSADATVATDKLVDKALERTRMLTAEGRIELFAQGPGAVARSEDPLIVLARGVVTELRARSRRDAVRNGRRLLTGRRWIEAQQAWRGKQFYPDANSTMRVSIASVKGYAPRDGAFHTPHTTVAGLLEKETGSDPFASPEQLLEAARTRIESRYYNAKIGDVPVCFLSDGDTTGGNSGSPVVNGRGELVGLNFDRVFEAVSGDYGWGAARSRNISVDIRFVLWFLESVVPAKHLLKEMGL